VEEALEANPKDVDALISLYRLPDNSPVQRTDAAAKVARALEQIDVEIQSLPEETQGYNEYAWLVANTEGDIEKATRYARLALEKSTDNSSFLDTLAHCHAAAGRIPAAVRTQSLAHRVEPHGQTIARNLARFRGQLPQP
jgi:Flp pilus assembly protein TadD